MIRKEFVQLRRDRITFATIVTIPLMQLVLFGYAINTQPRGLPTAVLLQESSDVGRSILKALENTKYFKITRQVPRRSRVRPRAGGGRGAVRDRNSARFRAGAAARRQAGAAGRGRRHRSGRDQHRARRAQQSRALALRNDRAIPENGAPPFEIRTHARYNPAGSSQLNIVPGLMGTILTLTMLIFTALSVTREIERGTMESLLSMPITPLEIMLGKIVPYVLIGFLQAALIVGAGVVLFDVPIFGNLFLLALLSTLFIATNLAVGYTFSTLAQNQLQAIQMAMMFFLPNMLLSGFVFPFLGMPVWAQWFSEWLPLTHYIRIVRSIMLKGSTLVRPALRHAGAGRTDAGGDDDRGDALPPHARLEPRQHAELAVGAAAVIGVGGPAGAGRPLEHAGAKAGEVKARAELPIIVVGAESLDLRADIERVERAQARGEPDVVARPDVDTRSVGGDHRRRDG